MSTKILAGLVAVALMLAYLSPMIIKMKDAALTGILLIGIVVMLVDLWQSLRKSRD